VPLLLSGNFPKEQKLEEMRRKGKPEEEIADWDSLATEVIQAINSKQLEKGSNKHVKNKKSICVFASQPQTPKLTIANHTRKCRRI
jgi:hypothetical protein